VKTTARVLITKKCNRNCEGCCNKDEEIMKDMQDLYSLNLPKQFKTICITGGEPMLDPKRVLRIVNNIRQYRKDIKIYLYTALWDEMLHTIIDHIDGIHYTIHKGYSYSDLEDFYKYQDLATLYREYKSFRVYIDNDYMQIIRRLKPWVFSRFEIKPWKDKCPLPENEVLFYYGGK